MPTEIIAVIAPLPRPGEAGHHGRAKIKQVRLLAGRYPLTWRPGEEIEVAEQVATVDGWRYCEHDGTTPIAAVYSLRVEI